MSCKDSNSHRPNLRQQLGRQEMLLLCNEHLSSTFAIAMTCSFSFFGSLSHLTRDCAGAYLLMPQP